MSVLDLPALIAHRGAPLETPENSLAGLVRAAELGADMVEFDVRLSADGVPMVFHDDRLERLTGAAGRFCHQDYARLRSLDLGGGERIPTLVEALAACAELDLAVNLELKPDPDRAAETAFLALAAARGEWPADAPPILVSSFRRDCLAVARREAPAWPRGLLVGRLPADWAVATARLDCAAVHADHRFLAPAAIASVRAAGLAVLAYTVNSRARAGQLLRAGVDAVFSDHPAFS